MSDMVIKGRIEQLKSMHEFMCTCSDESLLDCWLYVVPDEPMDEDFEYIAKDESLYGSACSCFKEAVQEGDWRW